jgi:phage FluMu protein Com
MNQLRCTHCGTVGLEQGFVEDTGRASFGFVRWVPGLLERGAFGIAKSRGRPRLQVDAFRCPNCAHLELFAANQV